MMRYACFVWFAMFAVKTTVSFMILEESEEGDVVKFPTTGGTKELTVSSGTYSTVPFDLEKNYVSKSNRYEHRTHSFVFR